MANTHSLDLELSSSQYAYIADGDQTGLDISGDITFEGWVNLEQLPSTPVSTFIMAGKWNASVSQEWLFFLGTDDKLTAYYDTDVSTPVLIKSDAAAVVANDVGNWVHLAAAVDVSAKTAAMYKNGGVIAASYQSGASTSITPGAANFAIGANYSSGTPGSFYDGKIDEVRIWNDIRTAGEISENYNKFVSASAGGLVAYYKFDNNYLDETTNNNDLTASGSPVFSTDVSIGGLGGNPMFFSGGGVTIG